MQALLWLTIAYRFGDEAVRLLDLKDSTGKRAYVSLGDASAAHE
jgi:hypothetical protein